LKDGKAYDDYIMYHVSLYCGPEEGYIPLESDGLGKSPIDLLWPRECANPTARLHFSVTPNPVRCHMAHGQAIIRNPSYYGGKAAYQIRLDCGKEFDLVDYKSKESKAEATKRGAI